MKEPKSKSHQVLSFVTVIRWQIEQLEKKNLRKLTKQQEEALKTIRENLDAITTIIEEMNIQ